MKRIRILAALIILVLVFVVFRDMGRGFMDGMNEGASFEDYRYAVTLNLKQKPGEALVPDSALYLPSQTRVPYEMESADVFVPKEGVPLSAQKIVIVVLFLSSLFFLYGLYGLIRTVVGVLRRGDVFTRKNIRRMRCFAYGLIVFGFFNELNQWMEYSSMASSVQFAGYEVVPYELKMEWLLVMMLALFIEIFAVGVKMKEEQDLTI
ncbi:MAG: DUF2975 domain-containing protein [Bacteroides sp.]|nr:DUF2975 domain-containing protein [Bacteroides sp.]